MTDLSHVAESLRRITVEVRDDAGSIGAGVLWPAGHVVTNAHVARRPRLMLGLVDGRHLADETVRLVWAVAGGRVALVSDATAAAGARPGVYRLGAVEICVTDGVPLRGDGVIAGTTLTMIDAMRNLHALGVPFADAVGAATVVPARLLGRADLGVLEVGGRADVVVLDDRLEITFATSRSASCAPRGRRSNRR